jgi:hypothetical protein
MPFFPWRPKTPDQPVVPPAPAPAPVSPDDVANPARAAWLKAWLLLRQIDKKKLGAAVFTVPVMVFLAVSGLVLWAWVLLRGIWAFFRSIFK